MTDSALQPEGGEPRTRRVERSEHRQPLLRNGIICAVVGLAAVIGGAVMFSALQAAQVLSSSPVTVRHGDRRVASGQLIADRLWCQHRHIHRA